MQSEVLTVPPDMLLQDILGMIYNSPTPIAVVKDGRLLGVLIRALSSKHCQLAMRRPNHMNNF